MVIVIADPGEFSLLASGSSSSTGRIVNDDPWTAEGLIACPGPEVIDALAAPDGEDVTCGVPEHPATTSSTAAVSAFAQAREVIIRSSY